MKDIWLKSLSIKDVSNQLRIENPRCRYQEILFRLSAVRWELSQKRHEHAKAHLCCVGESLFLLETRTLEFQVLHRAVVLEKSLDDKNPNTKTISSNLTALRELMESSKENWCGPLEGRLQKIAKYVLREQYREGLGELQFFKHHLYFVSHRQCVTKFRRKIQLLLREPQNAIAASTKLLDELERWASKNVNLR